MQLMTVREAAKRLGVGYSTLKQWIYQGRVRTHVTSGGHHRISDAEIDRLLAPSAPASATRQRGGRVTGIVALSGRNQLRAFVEEVRVSGLLAQVRMRIGGDQHLTAVITRDAIEELRLRRGDDVLAIVKSTEVMVAREAPKVGPQSSVARRPRRRAAR